jgi:alpha-beta hydrolase superfamily lysophospholipase
MWFWKTVAGPLLAVLVASGAAAQPAVPAVKRPDGSAIDWYLDRQTASPKQGILVLAQGSGCNSVTLSHNIETAKHLLPDFAVITVDKYGVRPGDDPKPTEDCSKTFYRHHTISQRVADYRQVIARAETLPWWNGQLVVFGGSEGAATVEILASQVKADAAVIYSGATGIPFHQAFIQNIPPQMAAEAPAELARIRRAPLSDKVWGGNSYRWWADIIDRPLWEDALKAKAPLLVVQGRRDRSNPVSSARALRDAFATAKQCNLTYWEYEDYDHAMADAAGASHQAEVFARISAWLGDRLKGAPLPGCGA